MNKITIVSAFFNINRANWEGFGRNKEQYFQYFTQWGKIENDLVVYVEDKILKERIELLRKDVLSKTTVILIEDIKKIDFLLYKSIENITSNQIHRRFRTKPNNPEVWNADYDYVMLMKMWCVNHAVEHGYVSGMVAWVDFGYLHGEVNLLEKAGGNFSWDYEFPEKINIFSVQPLDSKPIFDIVKNMDTYIMGTILVAPDNKWNYFWNEMRNNMIALNRCGLVDDDQTVILMCYRNNPEEFYIHESRWNLPVIQYSSIGNGKLENEKIKKVFCLKLIAKKMKETIANLKYSFEVFKDLQKLNRK